MHLSGGLTTSPSFAFSLLREAFRGAWNWTVNSSEALAQRLEPSRSPWDEGAEGAGAGRERPGGGGVGGSGGGGGTR